MIDKKEYTNVKKVKQNWLLTYSDMVTLLLVFFIVLFSTGETVVVKTRVILSTFSGNLGILNGGKTLDSSDSFVNFGKQVESLPSERTEQNLDSKTDEASALFSPFVENKRIRVVDSEDGVVISLFSDVFFDKDSARVSYQAMREVLQNINILLTSDQFKGEILIEGHTDNVPYQGIEFSDNWELSMARSLSVLNAIRSFPFVKQIKEDKLSMHAYGSTRPIEDNQNPIQRAYNRRVDIVLKRK